MKNEKEYSGEKTKMKKQYIFTERAHLMCPGMCFGIAGVLAAPCDKSRLKYALNALTYAHPFLKAVIGYEPQDDRYFYDITDSAKTQLSVLNETVRGLDDLKIIARFEQAVEKDTDLFGEGMLRIFAWKCADSTCVLFVFHHLLADGRGALGLVEEFADMYVSGKTPEPAEERLIASAQDLPLGAEFSGMGRKLTDIYNKKWVKEGNRLTYEQYHAFADNYQKTSHVKHTVSVCPPEKLKELLERCHGQGVTLNDYLLARMFEKYSISSIIIASDLRSRLDCYNQGALGNYSSAFTVKFNKRGHSLWKNARSIHSEVRNAVSDTKRLCLVLSLYCVMEPGLIDAAAAAGLGGFESKAAHGAAKYILGLSKPDGHCITNLGKLESTSLTEGIFIPPASPAMKLTQGVVTVNGKMHICTAQRYK